MAHGIRHHRFTGPSDCYFLSPHSDPNRRIFDCDISPQKADVIRVLGGDEERYIYGVELYKQGYGSKLIVSLGERLIPLLQRSSADIVRDFASSQGIPASDIIMMASESTYEEALLTKELIKQEGIRSVLVVSSPFHMRRVAMTFKRVIGSEAELTFVSVPLAQSRFDLRWWSDEDSISAVVHEYVSLIYYYFRYFF